MTKVRFVERTPRELRFKLGEDDPKLASGDVETIAQIFKTPLVGSYTWNYEECDRRIRKLYRLGKERNWNAETDIDWSKPFARTESPIHEGIDNPFVGWDVYDALDEKAEIEFAWHQQSWMLSQFLHGEQGALLVASQLVSCAPTYDAKLYAASQTFDEARHVEVFNKYIMDRVGFMYPVNPNLKILLDKILSDERWDLKFIGMQLIIESLALAAFNTQRMLARDPVMADVLELVTRDESRHVAFGVTYMEEFVKSLTDEEREDRAHFAYEACCVMRERIIATDVFEHYGWDPEEGRRRSLAGGVMEQFRQLLFTRIIPNLKKVGLITDSVRPLYEQLGVLQFENLVDDGQIDWAKLEEPLPAYVAAGSSPAAAAE
ncbi:MAG TPA: ferritin-like domain-containing protein [Polyangiaceae bacterium]|nr:ferritin-like domain-containing protein [Polyangiaceae bacterium]